MIETQTDRSSALSVLAEDVSEMLALVANSRRLLILCALVEGEKSVSDLQIAAELSQSALSQHLAKLRAAKVVSTRRQAQTIYYRLTDPKMKALMVALYDTFCQPSVDKPERRADT